MIVKHYLCWLWRILSGDFDVTGAVTSLFANCACIALWLRLRLVLPHDQKDRKMALDATSFRKSTL